MTVGVLDAYASPTIAKDADTYATQNGDGSYGSGQLTQVQQSAYTNQKACGPSGWFGEETLDVEAVHAMAPGADIRYYASKSCEDDDFLDALGTIVDQDRVQLVSNSWDGVEEGETTDLINAYETVFAQGSLEGISFLFSSGDDGDEAAATGIKQTDYPASDPLVTAVGGTADEIDGDGKLTGQAGWGTDEYTLSKDGASWVPAGFLYGGGGGSSALFDKPAYQSGFGTGASRQVPDVGLDADPNTGFLVGETQTFANGVRYDQYRIGGTSLASPLFAGLTALKFQASGGKGVGALNPTVYGSGADFRDVKNVKQPAGDVRADYADATGFDPSKGITYTVRTFGQDSSLAVTKGYDQVTGVGSPNTKWLTPLQ